MQDSKQPCVYILTNKRNGTLYTGMSSCIVNRLEQHQNSPSEKFVRKYRLDMLVYLETHDTLAQAALREKQIKKWNRAWKLRLIESLNPDWNDLTSRLT